MLDEGYIYDPGTGSYYVPDVAEPEAAASDAESTTQYQGDPEMLEEGFTYDPYLGVYLLDGEDFPMMDVPSSFLAASPNFPDFNPNMIPWETAPDYIKDILYDTPFIATTDTFYVDPWKIPFVLVLTNGDIVRVIVGINMIFGSYFASSDDFNSHKPTGSYVFCHVLNSSGDINPGVEYACIYEARYYFGTMETAVDWHPLTAIATGNRISRFTGSLTGMDLGWDYYLYGGNNIGPGRSNVNISINTSQTSAFPAFSAVSDSVLGFAGDISFIKFHEDYPYSYFASFVPATYEEKQLETEKGILSGIKGMWESIKSLPETIGEKLKSLFVPSEGYFDTYISDFQNYFKDRFGLLYELLDAVIDILQQFISYSPAESGYSIHFPEVVMPVLDNGEWHDQTLIEERDITFEFLEQGAFKTLYTMYRSVVWMIFVFALINLIIRKSERVFGG